MVRATARFRDPATLLLDDGRTVFARAVVIATGSTPSIPEPYRRLGDLVLTSNTIFDLADLPASVAVIGAPVALKRSPSIFTTASVAQLVATIDSEGRHIDRLVNAAGYLFPKPFLDHGADDFDRYHDLNRATFLITQAVARNMGSGERMDKNVR